MWRRRGRRNDPVPRGDAPREPAGLMLGLGAMVLLPVVQVAAFLLWPAPEGSGEAAGVDPARLAAVGVLRILVVAAALLVLRAARASPPGCRAAAGRAALAGALYALAFLPVLYGTVAVQEWIRQRAGGVHRPQELVEIATRGTGEEFLAVAAFAVLAAPFIEEGIFRGLFYGGLRARTGARAAALLTALGFAAIHVDRGGFDAVAPMFLMGLLLADLRERTGGLTAPLVMHATYNGLQVAAIYITRIGGGAPPGGG